MFDSLVSMSYNMGNYGLSSSKFVSDLKEINPEDPSELLRAAHKIKSTKLKDRFPGLKKRRKDEYEMFIKDTRA
ncbi:MAG: lysozyme [Chloroflexia bacterium]|nr:lysozyme [Chloroflexia bacterium]